MIEDSVVKCISTSSSAVSSVDAPGVYVEMVSFVRHVNSDALSGSKQVLGMQQSLSVAISANMQLFSQTRDFQALTGR